MVAAMTPRLLSRLLLPEQDVMSFFYLRRLRHLGSFLQMFWRSLDGEVVYKLFTGMHLIPTYGVLLLVLALSLAAYLLVTPVGTPTANPRYFTCATILAMLLLARA